MTELSVRMSSSGAEEAEEAEEVLCIAAARIDARIAARAQPGGLDAVT